MGRPSRIPTTKPKPIEILVAPDGSTVVRVRKGESVIERVFKRNEPFQDWIDIVVGVSLLPQPSADES